MAQNKLSNVTELPVNTYQLTEKDIKKYICPLATDEEVFIFLRLCESQRLNPFIREVYLIKYKQDQPATTVVGKDVFLKRAVSIPSFNGFKAGIIVLEGEKISKPEGNFYLKDKQKLVGGWAEVYTKDKAHPVRIEIPFLEYVQTKWDAKEKKRVPNSIWQGIPSTMIRKVALVQALRESFPNEFGGLYDSSEMPINLDKLPEEKIVVEDSVPVGELGEEERIKIAEEFEQPYLKPENLKATVSNVAEDPFRERAYEEWEDRMPEDKEEMEAFVARSCKRFYAFMNAEYDCDNEQAKRRAEELLGFESGAITSMKDIVKYPGLRRDLNIAIWEDKNKVLFP